MINFQKKFHKNWPGAMKNQPGTMKNHKNQPGTMKNHKKPRKTNLEPWKTMKNHEKPTWNHKKPWKTNLAPWKTIKADLEPWETMKNQPGTIKNICIFVFLELLFCISGTFTNKRIKLTSFDGKNVMSRTEVSNWPPLIQKHDRYQQGVQLTF